MKVFSNSWFIIIVFFVVTGCMPFGSGSLKNYVTIKVKQKAVIVKLPKGYCTDENARVLSDTIKTNVITNCISVKQNKTNVFGRRPVDTVVHLTITDMRLSSFFSEKEFLNTIKDNLNLKKIAISSESVSLQVKEKTKKDGLVWVDLKQTKQGSSIRKIRKYIFVVGDQAAIMTVITLQRKNPSYKTFEKFIRSIKKVSS